MSYFYFSIGNISRGKSGAKKSGASGSISYALAYINGRCIYDNYEKKSRKMHTRDDIIARGVVLPKKAPKRLFDLQTLSNEVNNAEKRKDARTAQVIVMSLPNALPREAYATLVETFCHENFVKKGRCVSYAIHAGGRRDKTELKLLPSIEERQDNPHAHLIIPFRPIDECGFCETKLESRMHSTKAAISAFRKSWADIQNQTFERARLEVRVTHLSLKDQGKSRTSRPHISAEAYALERMGIPTRVGDECIKAMLQNQTDESLKRKIQYALEERERIQKNLERWNVENAEMRQKQLQLAKEREEREFIADNELARASGFWYSIER